MQIKKLKESRRWLILIIAGTLFTLSQFYRSSVAVISPSLINELNLGAWELSTVSASFFYAFALMQIPVGIFLDSIGPRITMTLLTFVAVAGAFLFAVGESYYSLTFGRVLLGVGMACNFMGTLKLITIWFDPKYFATLSALVVSVSTAGTIAATTPLVLMVEFTGWRSSFMIMGGVTFFIAILFFVLVRDSADNKSDSQLKKSSNPKIGETIQKAKILFSQRDFWIISFSTFCRYGIFASVQALWAGPYLMTATGFSPVTAGNIILLMSIGIIFGSPVSGYLSDHIFNSRKRIIIPGIWGMAAILGVLIFLPDGTGKITMSVLFFLFGLFSSSGQIMYAHIKEQVPHENAGMAMTAINFFTMAGVAVFLQGMGSVMKFLYPGASLGIPAFRTAFSITGIFLVIIALLYTLTAETLTSGKSKT